MKSIGLLLGGLSLLLAFSSPAAESREARVRSDRTNVLADGRWIYNDLAAGVDEAKKSGLPMLVVLRCVP